MKNLFSILGIMCFSFGAIAQTTTVVEAPDFHRVEFGFRFMPTVSAFKMKTSDGGTVQGQATLGYGIGGMLAINLTDHIGIQGEIIYNSLTQKYKDQDLERTIHVDYVNIPMLLALNTGKSRPVNLCFVAGPQMGYNVGSRVTTAGSSGQDTMQAMVVLKKGDFGFAYGADIEFALNETRTMRLDLGYRGVWGFLDISQPTTSTANSRSFNVVDHNNIKTNSIFAGLTFLF